jgi:hypothetical protein
MPLGGYIVGSAIIGAGAGMASSSKASSAADRASQSQLKAAQQDLAFRQQMYQDAQAKYGPLEQQLLGQANSSQPLGYEMLSGQMQQQYADALRRIGEQGNIGMGGLAGGAARQSQFGLATGLGSAYAQGQMNRLALGQSLLGRDPSTQLGMNVQGGFQGMGNIYGQQAGMYGQLAGQGANAASQSLQGLGYNLGQMYGQGGFGQNNYINSRFAPIVDAGGWSSLPTSNIGTTALPPVPGVVG